MDAVNRTCTVAEVQAELPALLRAVQNGDRVSIVSEGRTIATLEPPCDIIDRRDFGAGRYVEEADPTDEGAVSRARIRELVESGRVGEARNFIETATGDLGNWPDVLAPPRAIPGPPKPASGRGDLHINMQWLQAHREEYRGRWVAMRDGRLVDCDPDLLALRARLDTAGASACLLNVDQVWPLVER